MAIIGTYNGAHIIGLPCDTIPYVTAPSSIEWTSREFVSSNESPFTGQVQTYDWQFSMWQGNVSFPPMDRWSADAWSSFILSLRGPLNLFALGDPRGALPKGSAKGTPVVDGAGQSGYTLQTRGWAANEPNVMLAGDYIQIGSLSGTTPPPRLYKLQTAATADANGNATLSVWPNLRDLPIDGSPIVTKNCKGLFRLRQAQNRFSVNPATYGVSALAIQEAL